MKAPTIRTLGLLFTVVLLAWLTHTPRLSARPATGIHVNLVRRGPDPDPYATDADGLYTLTILSHRKARVRHEEIPLENLGDRLRTHSIPVRQEASLFIKGKPIYTQYFFHFSPKQNR